MSTRRNRDRRTSTTAALLALLRCLALAAPGWGQGGVVLMGIDAEGGGVGGHGPIGVYADVVDFLGDECVDPRRGTEILVLGADGTANNEVTAFWTALAAQINRQVTFVDGEAAITSAVFQPYAILAIVSDESEVNGGLTQLEHAALVARQGDIASFISAGGGLIGMYSGFSDSFGYLGGVGTIQVMSTTYSNVTPTGVPDNPIPPGFTLGPGNVWHQTFTMFPSFLEVLALEAGTDEPAVIGGCEVSIPPPCASITGGEPICSTDGSGDFTYTFEVTNTGEETVHDLFLLRPTAGVTVSPNYFDFSNDPICSTEQPGCSVDDATRSLTVTIGDAAPGDSVSFLVSLHDATVSECCSVEHTVELPDCECGQIVDDLSVCSLRFPPFSTRQEYTFTFQNLHPHVVDEVLIAPTNGTQVTVTPNVLSGLGLAAFPYTGAAGEHTQTVTLTGPDARAGREVCLRISAHDDGFEECCSVERCFEVDSCWDWVDDAQPLGDADLSVFGASFLRVSGIDGEGDDGLAVDLGGADGVEIGMLGFEEPTPVGAYWTMSGLGGGSELFSLRLEDVGEEIAAGLDVPGATSREYQIRHLGRAVAEGALGPDDTILLPDDAWLDEDAAGPAKGVTVTVTVTVTVEAGGIEITIEVRIEIEVATIVASGDGSTEPVIGDEVVFTYATSALDRPAIDRLNFLAAGIPEVVFTDVSGTVTDCNGNGVSDALDLADGTSADADGSGVPDECEVEPALLDLSLDTAFSEAAGRLVAPGARDDDWRIIDGATTVPARRVMRKNRGWNTPLPGSDWISLDGRRGASAAGFETLLFERCFCLADTAHDAALEADLFADDRATVFLNGEPIGGPGGRFDAARPLSVRYHGHLGESLFRAGENCLVVTVDDTGGVVTGLDLSGRVVAEGGACVAEP